MRSLSISLILPIDIISEIYGSIAEEKTELNGLVYVLERLPEGIEQCRFINLTSDEGYDKAHFNPIIPPKRRRNCYRIDDEQMNIEITRGRSDIYDILTHLTFLFIESHKIGKRVLIEDTDKTIRDWNKLEAAVKKNKLSQSEREVALIHTANILGRPFEEILEFYESFATQKNPEKFLLRKMNSFNSRHGHRMKVPFMYPAWDRKERRSKLFAWLPGHGAYYLMPVMMTS